MIVIFRIDRLRWNGPILLENRQMICTILSFLFELNIRSNCSIEHYFSRRWCIFTQRPTAGNLNVRFTSSFASLVLPLPLFYFCFPLFFVVARVKMACRFEALGGLFQPRLSLGGLVGPSFIELQPSFPKRQLQTSARGRRHFWNFLLLCTLVRSAPSTFRHTRGKIL